MKKENLTRRRFLQSSLTAASLAILANGQTPENMKKEISNDKNKTDSPASELSIACLLFDEMTALDAVGPYEVLSRIENAKIYFVGETAGLKRTDTKMLALNADYAISDVPKPDILLIPGGNATEVMKSEKVLNWIRTAHQTTQWTASACTGSLILAAAGLLKGSKAASHWVVADLFPQYGATYVADRYVQTGKIITSSGISAGIDMALFLAAQIKGAEVAKMIQLFLEYDPQPPFDSGSMKKASKETIEAANRYIQERRRQRYQTK